MALKKARKGYDPNDIAISKVKGTYYKNESRLAILTEIGYLTKKDPEKFTKVVSYLLYAIDNRDRRFWDKLLNMTLRSAIKFTEEEASKKTEAESETALYSGMSNSVYDSISAGTSLTLEEIKAFRNAGKNMQAVREVFPNRRFN